MRLTSPGFCHAIIEFVDFSFFTIIVQLALIIIFLWLFPIFGFSFLSFLDSFTFVRYVFKYVLCNVVQYF